MFTFLTAGESHGKCLTAIIEGVVSGLSLNEEHINTQLRRRQVGFGRGERMKIEEDKVEITSGVRYGKTLGSPITLVIKNKDWENWKEVMSQKPEARRQKSEVGRQKTEDRGGQIITTPRPGHADLAGLIKYQQEDIRNILERSSARETAVRCAVGAVAKRLLEEFSLEVLSWVIEIGGVRCQMPDARGQKAEDRSQMVHGPRSTVHGKRKKLWTMDYGLWTDIRELFQRAEESVLRCPDKIAERRMIEKIKSAKREGDTLGGIFEVVAIGAPVGLGSYVHWERRLDGKLARALMSIPAIKGVEIGLGFALSSLSGSEVHDEIFYKKGFYRKTNNAGGLEGGITNGELIILRAVMKPIPTLSKPLKTVDFKTKEKALSFKERADICALPSASVVGEAVVAIELAKAMGEKFAGDSLTEMKRNFSAYLRYVKNL